MLSPFLLWVFNELASYDFVSAPFDDSKDMMVLEQTLEKKEFEDWPCTEEDFDDDQYFYISGDLTLDEKHQYLQDMFLNDVPCRKVTICHSYTQEGYACMTLKEPTYYEILDAICNLSTCGFNGDCKVHGDSEHGYIVF